MKIFVSSELNKVFIESHKNYNYSLSFLLNSIDTKACDKVIKMIDNFDLSGTRMEIEIDEKNISLIKKIFGKADNELIEILLWVSILFPEI